ncbi:Druantia anti-phage system protein DruA [Piscirickettsia salmonis]|uniref:Druantia anti-phage system protein DruA n=1 Tax=Piscirickettsia salmonis TaxID=1238 RepID=UPI0006BDED9B|nr:Druantia anti-phage system protein DruA [Piscirickettsia salmonis]ALA26681.1 hypothetical protein KW89_3p55 [Piscirickettsia salmonis]APS45892.1 hypothetical protein AVI48_15795 [Piscirickettsia salmonis]APS49225.1 hypothetical protein AVI49_16330 [Piscirickettsia salmonis]QGO82297.1 hypothetical protein Psal107_03348 [Piscirickettsia salmonis]QGP24126.1 hypothetical protein Psal158_03300 [Piscirickettsia salmonis]
MTTINVTSVLLVRDPWATQLLTGYKRWEIRGTNLSKAKHTTVAIAKSGEKGISRIYGIVDLVDCKGPLTLQELQDNYDQHRDIEDTNKLPYQKTYAWVVSNPKMLKKPINYQYKNGWVIWGVGCWTFNTTKDFVNDHLCKTLTGPSKLIKQKFINSLTNDLKLFDINLQYSEVHGEDKFNVVCLDDNLEPEVLRQHLNSSFSKLQDKNRKFNSSFISQMETILSANKLLATKCVDLSKLDLSIELVKSSQDKSIHKYFRMHQNIPSHVSIGRIVDAIVYHNEIKDNKIISKHIVGVIGVGSCAYTSGVRDDLFGWPLSNNANSDIKNNGLKSLVQINCIVAAYPYNDAKYRITKLLALSVFSDTITNNFRKKYGSPLLAAISSAGFGPYSHLFDRISLHSIVEFSKKTDTLLSLTGEERNQEKAFDLWKNPSFKKTGRKKSRHHIFQREAETTTCLNQIVSEETLILSKELCASSSSMGKHNSYKHALSKSLQYCGVSNDIFPKVTRGVYIGILDNKYILKLVTGRASSVRRVHSIPWDVMFKWWKSHEEKRIKNIQLKTIHITAC